VDAHLAWQGLRKSTMPIHDPEVYRPKPANENVPLPHVASLACPAPKPSHPPPAERFEGRGSIYTAARPGPPPNAYADAALSDTFGARAVAAPTFDKLGTSERFAGADSIYASRVSPAPTAYADAVAGDGCSFGSKSVLVPEFEKQERKRFAGPDSIYRKGLRKSTIPSQQCNDLARGSLTISKDVVGKNRRYEGRA